MTSSRRQSRAIALIDANILHSPLIRGLVLAFAEADLFQPRWSAEILNETIRSIARRRPDVERAKLDLLRASLELAFPDAAITGYKGLIDGLSLPDANDLHVLAAAIRGRCDILVTLNLDDFPAERLSEFDIEPQHPDAFVRDYLLLHPATALSCIRSLLSELKNPIITIDQYLANLRRESMHLTAAEIEKARDLLTPSAS